MDRELVTLDKVFKCELRAECEEFIYGQGRVESTGSQLLNCLHYEVLQRLLELDVSGNPEAAKTHRKLVTEVKTVSSNVSRAIELSALDNLSGRIGGEIPFFNQPRANPPFRNYENAGRRRSRTGGRRSTN